MGIESSEKGVEIEGSCHLSDKKKSREQKSPAKLVHGPGGDHSHCGE
ncbi:hypothetical protein LFE_2186 [Leptospirillum ferrooxidans C2-3]|uniref:Uncharacterized protein n=1 Tax=Leptospirillum ferrooxidans (strain C2-3) TaxID=1162668 RepID=I0IRG0_LEPFC|nr:hypothetical protein LFE_2186 [Leptospirillum ferrooxidans C2-3]